MFASIGSDPNIDRDTGQTLVSETISSTDRRATSPEAAAAKRMMDVQYIRRSLAWIHAMVFGHVSEFQQKRVKTNLVAARICIRSYTKHLIAGT
jgi:hypothetical protein